MSSLSTPAFHYHHRPYPCIPRGALHTLMSHCLLTPGLTSAPAFPTSPPSLPLHPPGALAMLISQSLLTPGSKQGFNFNKGSAIRFGCSMDTDRLPLQPSLCASHDLPASACMQYQCFDDAQCTTSFSAMIQKVSSSSALQRAPGNTHTAQACCLMCRFDKNHIAALTIRMEAA